MKIRKDTRTVLGRYIVFSLDTVMIPIFESFNTKMKEEFFNFKKGKQHHMKYKPSTTVVSEMVKALKEKTHNTYEGRHPITFQTTKMELYLHHKRRPFISVMFSAESKRTLIGYMKAYLNTTISNILKSASKVVRLNKRNMMTEKVFDTLGQDLGIGVLQYT